MPWWTPVIGGLAKLLWSQRGRLKPKATDEELRAVARLAWSHHALGSEVPFSVVQGWARDQLAEMGHQLDDETDARLTDVLDNERARLRMPAQLDKLVEIAEGMEDEFKDAERRGRAAVTSWAETDNGDDKKEKE
jgi:hypothetical protein